MKYFGKLRIPDETIYAGVDTVMHGSSAYVFEGIDLKQGQGKSMVQLGYENVISGAKGDHHGDFPRFPETAVLRRRRGLSSANASYSDPFTTSSSSSRQPVQSSSTSASTSSSFLTSAPSTDDGRDEGEGLVDAAGQGNSGSKPTPSRNGYAVTFGPEEVRTFIAETNVDDAAFEGIMPVRNTPSPSRSFAAPTTSLPTPASASVSTRNISRDDLGQEDEV